VQHDKRFIRPERRPAQPVEVRNAIWDGEKDADAIEHALPHSDYLALLLAAVRDHVILFAAVMPQCGGFPIPAQR
jgi:hypothetical protein